MPGMEMHGVQPYPLKDLNHAYVESLSSSLLVLAYISKAIGFLCL